MERWRSFFSKAGEDVWTIIEQAILLAAHDHPREFKEKRCDIAETLFARRLCQGDAAATRLSMSVITNCTNPTDVFKAMEDEHASAACTKVQAMHDAPDDGPDVHACIATLVCNIKETLDDSMKSDGAVLLGLQKLESLQISVDVLKETEIGKHVNTLRKHSCKEIRLLAKGLVRHWKELVDDWVNGAGTLGHTTSARNNLEEERVLTALDEDAHFPRETQQHSFCDAKDRKSYVEAPEERGSSSRAELGGLDRAGSFKKPRSNVSSVANREILEDERNMAVDEPTGGSKSNGKESVVSSRNYGAGKLFSHDSNANNCHGGYGCQMQKQSRPTFNQKLSYHETVHPEVKLDAATKRKPHDSLIEIDNAKRQQAAHPTNLRDLSQAGLLQSKRF